MKKSDSRTSADFEDFLKEEGILEEVRAGALKKVSAARKTSKLCAPIYLNKEVRAFVEEIARKRSKDVSTVVNELLMHDKSLIDAVR